MKICSIGNFHTSKNFIKYTQWKICVKFNTFHVSQTVHSNYTLTQDEYVRK